MVVLVNADTASAAEIVTGALQDHHRAVVVGTHTYGKGVFTGDPPLSNGGALEITVGRVLPARTGATSAAAGSSRARASRRKWRSTSGIDTTHGLDVALSTLAAKAR